MFLDLNMILNYAKTEFQSFIKFHEHLAQEIKRGVYDERAYLERTKLDLIRVMNDTMKAWIIGALKIEKKINNHPHTDIRRFFGS